MNWRTIELFKGIDLNDSFVLEWCHSKNQFVIELEASIWPESKYYKQPKINEYTCYQKARLSFINIKSCTGLRTMKNVKPTIDPDGSKDYGNIYNLESNCGSFMISGEFGKVEITGGEIQFEIHT